jgi:hypothetical protein
VTQDAGEARGQWRVLRARRRVPRRSPALASCRTRRCCAPG